MRYSLTPLKNGECQVRNYIAFHGCDDESTSTFYLYIWLIEGGEKPMIVDTGPKEVEEFNWATASYIPGGIRQAEGERTPDLLRSSGIDPEDVSHVFITHLHPDHYEYFDLFVNAQMVVNRRGFLEGLLGVKRNVMQALARRWPESLRLVEDEEVLPGIRTLWLGCHSPCSQAILVDTEEGRVALCGDVAYTFRNIEGNIPIGGVDPKEWFAAMEKVRGEADILLPGHDPEILRRWPRQRDIGRYSS
jgi:glyoxylase-like metal-dependent hydrolase (beta-lactamase superfamily II)